MDTNDSMIGNTSIWKIFKMTIAGHLQSTRFVILMAGISLTFIGALISALWSTFPFAIFAGVMNGAIGVTYAVKTFEPGAQKRRNENSLRVEQKIDLKTLDPASVESFIKKEVIPRIRKTQGDEEDEEEGEETE